nr:MULTISPECIES: VCBS repeat-containing protein [unclassified Streptomyces]
MGRGWGIYDRIEAAGNLGGAAHGDLLARDKAGVLWLYLGTGTGGVTERIRIGGGWGVYDRIVAGSDLTSDGRADALAVDKSGALWLYAGTGDYKRPFAARKRIGHGWGVYDDIATVGNIAGGPAGDLVARDKSGVLWQYLGKGDGTFAARTKVGGGWNTFTRVVGAGDVDGDGRPDLLGIRPGGAPALYKSTGDWKVPFRPAEKTHADLSTNGLGLVF